MPFETKAARIQELMLEMTGTTREEANAHLCFLCKTPVDLNNGFRDELSRREYGISRLCQACQDFAFAAPDDED